MEREIITSRKNPKIIAAASLKEKKYRDENSLFFIEGRKLLHEAILSGLKIQSLFLTDKASKLYKKEVDEALCVCRSVYCVTEEVYSKLSDENSPEGIFAVLEKFETHDANTLVGGAVILEDVRNPQNLGTIARTACALGVENLLLTNGCADIYNGKTQRAAMGALFRLKIFVTDDLVREISHMKEHGRVFASALDDRAKSLTDIEFCETDSIVIGNEGSGITDAVCSACTDTLIIPMFNGTESLNASAAATVFIWEMRKGQDKK